jgi:hypothetical protein
LAGDAEVCCAAAAEVGASGIEATGSREIVQRARRGLEAGAMSQLIALLWFCAPGVIFINFR